MKTKTKRNKKSAVLFVICIIAIFTFAYLGFNGAEIGGWKFKTADESITKGLDLQGGVSVTMEIQDENSTKRI
jgi:preprotein translocase subunit SecD